MLRYLKNRTKGRLAVTSSEGDFLRCGLPEERSLRECRQRCGMRCQAACHGTISPAEAPSLPCSSALPEQGG